MVFLFDNGVAPAPRPQANSIQQASNIQPLPVIIAGAGPSGLVAALTLQKYGVPFIIYERAASDKICSNVGRCIDMSPSSIKILEKQLGFSDNLNALMKPYEFIEVSDMDGGHVNTLRFKEMSQRKRRIEGKRDFSFASRSKLQHALLEALGLVNRHGSIKDKSDGILRCGIAVTGYKKMTGNFVQVELDNGVKVKASALMACDGLHSSVRQCMHERSQDNLSFTNQEGWWGTTVVKPGSALEQQLQHIAASRKIQGYNVGLIVVGTSENPGCFFANEISKNVYSWSYFIENKTSNADADLIRRGGKVLNEAEKKSDLVDKIPSTCKILKLFSECTPAVDITRSAIFHRGNNLATVDGRVVLLGDAACQYHPMSSEGSNKAIADGYAAALRLATAIMGKSYGSSRKPPSIEKTLVCFDSYRRRKGNSIMVQKSFKYGQCATSNSALTCWARKTFFKLMSPSKTIREVRKGDKSNGRFVADTIKAMKPYPKPDKPIIRPFISSSKVHDSVQFDITKSKSFREEDVGCVCIDF